MKQKKRLKRVLIGKIACRRYEASRQPRSRNWTILVNTEADWGRAHLFSPTIRDLFIDARQSLSPRVIDHLSLLFERLKENTPR